MGGKYENVNEWNRDHKGTTRVTFPTKSRPEQRQVDPDIRRVEIWLGLIVHSHLVAHGGAHRKSERAWQN